MKRILITFTAACVLLASATSCSVLSSVVAGSGSTTTTNTSSAINVGQIIGSILKSLYEQYKTTGSLTLNSTENLVNVANLATNYASIKTALTDKANYQAFAQGLISGAKDKISESNVNNVIASLSNLNLSALTNAQSTSEGTSLSSTAKSTATAILTKILSTMDTY